MRLIDADELIATVEADVRQGVSAKDVLEVIKESPIIDAIPIEFIENEKRLLDKWINVAVEDKNIEWARMKICSSLALDSLIMNWAYGRGEE